MCVCLCTAKMCIYKDNLLCFFDMCFTDLVSEFSHRTNLHIHDQKTRGALAFHSRGNTVGTDHAPMAREWDAGMTSDKLKACFIQARYETKLCRIFVSSAPLQDQQPTLCCKPKLQECGANSLLHFQEMRRHKLTGGIWISPCKRPLSDLNQSWPACQLGCTRFPL